MNNSKLAILFTIISFALPADLFQDWLDQIYSYVDSTGVEISFNYQYSAQSKDEISGGFLRYHDSKNFLYQLDKKTVFAVDSVWKTYDKSTNQVFIHDPDLQFEDLVLKWFQRDTLLAPNKVQKISPYAYSVHLSADLSNFDIIFSDNNTVNQIIIYSADDAVIINVESINLISAELKEPFKLALPDAFELDLRE